MVRLTTSDGKTAYVNPNHVTLLAPAADNKTNQILVGTCLVIFSAPSIPPLHVNTGLDETADLLARGEAKSSLINIGGV